MLGFFFFFFQAEDGIRDLVRSRGLGDVYKRQGVIGALLGTLVGFVPGIALARSFTRYPTESVAYGEYTQGAPALLDPTVVIPWLLSLIHI